MSLVTYGNADDEAADEDEGPPPAHLGRAAVAVVADDWLHLAIDQHVNSGI
jgi:hypothetical protein